MFEVPAVVGVEWSEVSSTVCDGLVRLLASYHLRTEAEKGAAVDDVAGLPDRYRLEITDPRAAFASKTVLAAVDDEVPVGCVVVDDASGDAAEIKRLWVDPAVRGRGIGSALLRAALDHARRAQIGVIRLSVWRWRVDALALYARFGFTEVISWDSRDQVVCMRRVV